MWNYIYYLIYRDYYTLQRTVITEKSILHLLLLHSFLFFFWRFYVDPKISQTILTKVEKGNIFFNAMSFSLKENHYRNCY